MCPKPVRWTPMMCQAAAQPTHTGSKDDKIVIEMDRVPPEPLKDPATLIRTGAFTLDRLLTHIDPGPQEESEEFVRRIYEQRHLDLSSGSDNQTGSRY
jgi:hypothetical protein